VRRIARSPVEIAGAEPAAIAESRGRWAEPVRLGAAVERLAAADDAAPAGKIARWLFVAFASFYLLLLGGHIYSPDGTVMFRVTERIATAGRFDFRPLESWPEFGGLRVVDSATGESRFYAWFGLGLSLAALPQYWLGQLLVPLASEGEQGLFEQANAMAIRHPGADANGVLKLRRLYYDSSRAGFREAFLAFMVSATSAFIVAGVVAGVLMLGVRLGYGRWAALATAVAVGLATPMWHYSKEFFSEPLAALGLVWFLYHAVAGARPASSCWHWAAAGALLGLCVLVKPANVVLIPPAAALLLLYLRPFPGGRARRHLLVFTLALAALLGLVAWYNDQRFGSPFEVGYGAQATLWTTPFWEGVKGLLASPGRGLLIYCPLVWLALAGARRFGKRRPLELAFSLVCLIVTVSLYARWHMWEGGWCWGPRFLVPVLPLIVLPVIAVFDRLPTRLLGRVAVVGTLAFSFLVALSGVVVGYHELTLWVRAEHRASSLVHGLTATPSYHDMVCWDWAYAPIWRNWAFPFKDYVLLPHAVVAPGLVLALFAMAFTGLVVGLVGLSRAWVRAEETRESGGSRQWFAG
jgi:hypothetical protein